MNKIVEKAMQLNQFKSNLPQLEVGDVITLGEVWSGEGETPQYAYSYLLTHDGEDGQSNYDVNINYEFEVIEEKENALETIVKITNIELV